MTAKLLSLFGLPLIFTGCGPKAPEAPAGPPDPVRGKSKMVRYGCATCHEIPGMPPRGMATNIGPALGGFAGREKIAGLVPHTEENLIKWLRKPQEINPRTAMPNLGISEADAKDIAAFLATLKDAH